MTRSRSARRSAGSVAFVLSSGANLGAVQVGMLRALFEADVVPDIVLGCSVGALNGAAIAEEPTLERVIRLQEIWAFVEPRAFMPRSWVPSPAMVLIRRSEAMYEAAGLRRLVRRTLEAEKFEDLKLPFSCVATDIMRAHERWFDSGPLLDAIVASASMPGVYPSVELDGGRYLDGAILNDVPVQRAAELGADTIYVLEAGTLSGPVWTEPRRPISTLLQATVLARRHRYRQALAALPDHVVVHHLPQGDLPDVGLLDFSHGPQLTRIAHEATADYLRSDRPERSVSGRSVPDEPKVPTGAGSRFAPGLDLERLRRSSLEPAGPSPWRHAVVPLDRLGRITLPVEARLLRLPGALRVASRDRVLILRTEGAGALLHVDRRARLDVPEWLQRLAGPAAALLVSSAPELGIVALAPASSLDAVVTILADDSD